MKRTARGLGVLLTLILGTTAAADDAKKDAKKDAPPSKESPSSVVGTWLGTLKVQSLELRLGFKIHADKDGKLKATLESPDQGAAGIATESAEFKDGKLIITHSKLKLTYTAQLSPDGKQLIGELDQGAKMKLNLARVSEIVARKRPQMPKKPYPYREEQVTFDSVAKDVKLAGTLTLPEGKGPFPAAILVSGSGPQDRDETLLGHKPFWVIADYLTRQGVAVLRYDDRGVGKSTGDFEKALTPDFADDTVGAVRYLIGRPEIDGKKVGIIGHSEGGLVAPLAAVAEPRTAYIVMLAGPGINGIDVLYGQSAAILRATGVKEEIVAKATAMQKRIFPLLMNKASDAEIKKLGDELEKSMTEEERKALRDGDGEAAVKMMKSDWMHWFLKHDPRPTLTRVKCPVLAITGEKDLQVLPKDNNPEIVKALTAGKNPDFTVKELPGLNHLFQKCKTGAPAEYAVIEETFDPEALELLGRWIKDRMIGKK